MLRRILADDVLPVANLLIAVSVDIDWRNDGACRLIEVNLRGGYKELHYDLNRLISLRAQIYDAGTVSLYLAFGIDPSPLILPTPSQGRAVVKTAVVKGEERDKLYDAKRSLWEAAENPNMSVIYFYLFFLKRKKSSIFI